MAVRYIAKILLLCIFVLSVGQSVSIPGCLTQVQDVFIPMEDMDNETFSKEVTYLVGYQKVPWLQAYILCKQNGMELAAITSAKEQKALEKYLNSGEVKDVSEHFWLGGTRHGSLNGDFVWASSGKPVIYSKFLVNQPDNAGKVENCLELYTATTQGNFYWNDHQCDIMHPFICQSR